MALSHNATPTEIGNWNLLGISSCHPLPHQSAWHTILGLKSGRIVLDTMPFCNICCAVVLLNG